MGIIEFHLHEPDFEFAPSKTVGDGGSGESEEAYDESEWESEESEESEGGRSGALVALAVLVVLGLLVGMKRRRGGSADADTKLDAEDEVEVYD